MRPAVKAQQHSSSTRKLTRLLKQLQQREVSIRVSALEALVKIDHPCVFDVMVKGLSDRNPTVRVTAAENLGTLNQEKAVPYLINKLSDSNGEVRVRSVESLGTLLRGKSTPTALIKRLQDRDQLVRTAAAEALGVIGDQKALPALRKALRDASPLVRSYALESIGKLGNQKDLVRLERALVNEKAETARVGYYHALYLLGKHSILQQLVMLLESPEYRVRCATANTLAEIVGDDSERQIVLRNLRKALRQEPAVAVRSSIRASIRRLSE